MQGLVVNGAKVYVCGLESDNITNTVEELNRLGKESGNGGIAFGFVLVSLLEKLGA